MQPAALPEDQVARDELARRLAGLSMRPVHGQGTSPIAARVSGRTFAFETNEQKAETVSFDFAGDRSTVTIVNGEGTHTLVAGSGAWIAGTTTYAGGVSRPGAACGAWTGEQTYELRLRYTLTPFGFTLICRFEGDCVSLDHKDNVSFGSTEHPRLVGRLAEVHDPAVDVA
jgi:hypothetical protein